MKRSPNVRANAIRLKRQEHGGSFLVVEGRDDRLFFEQFVDRQYCWVIVANEKQNVADVVGILEAAGFPGVAGVTDADSDHVEGIRPASDNIILLETVDLEALLIRSPALDRILVELGSSGKIAGFGANVRDTLLAAALPIGCLRIHSRRSGLNLTFDGLRYGRCIELASLMFDVFCLIREVENRSQRSDLPCNDVAREIDIIQGSVEDRWLVCYGADMVQILALGLRKTLGTNNAQAVAPEVVRRCLRLAYQWADLNDSRLGRDLRVWEAKNPEFRVFGDADYSE